jgi:6-pyruvoyltetrahydropterin/6-carboxytetrahydropterin synthase
MTKVTCTRRVSFCSGHRVWRHESKCAHLHGHNYVALFELRGGRLDEIGRVIDFGEVKRRLGGWIDEHWDHGFLLHREDAAAIGAVSQLEGQKLFLLDRNPTAENLAEYLLRVVSPRELEGTGVAAVRVALWETENCLAEATIEDGGR